MKYVFIVVMAIGLGFSTPSLAQNGDSSASPQEKNQRGPIDILTETKGFNLNPYLGQVFAKVKSKWYGLILRPNICGRSLRAAQGRPLSPSNHTRKRLRDKNLGKRLTGCEGVEMETVEDLYLRNEDFPAHLSLFEGADAIHVEARRVIHVRVSQVSWDDWGIKATCTDLLMPGMNRCAVNPVQISSAWDCFSYSPIRWDARYLFKQRFDPILVRECVELGKKAYEQGRSLDKNEWDTLEQDYDFIVKQVICSNPNRHPDLQTLPLETRRFTEELICLSDEIKIDNASGSWKELVQRGRLCISPEQWTRWRTWMNRLKGMSQPERESAWRGVEFKAHGPTH